MVKIYLNLDETSALTLEEFIDETADPNWTVERMNDPVGWSACGYFDSAEAALESYKNLRDNFGFLPEKTQVENVVEEDWKNAYKAYLKPWSCKNLHWVPVWLKDSYPLPQGAKAFYFDAQMAFGTGDHPTTRLCAQALQKYISRTPDFAGKVLIDAGCGSGILAVSAALLGFKNVSGFDIDPEAVIVSRQNADSSFSGLPESVFYEGGIEDSLRGKTCDILLANILANILSDNAKPLVDAVNAGGTLVLSGILNTECKSIENIFVKQAADRLGRVECNSMGEWSSITIEFRK